MARKSTRNAQGAGTIRKKTVTRGGKMYTYWEARYTEGVDPGSGKQVQRSITGKTQKEVSQKLKAITTAIDTGTYTPPNRLTAGEWLDIWSRDYLAGAKASTIEVYKYNIRLHIKPAMGAVKLSELHPHTVQSWINGLELAPTTTKVVCGILKEALEKAVKLGYIPRNPVKCCELPRQEQREIHPLDDQQLAALLKEAKGRSIEHVVTVALFTGMRLSEVLGLTWDAIDFAGGTITVDKQLAPDIQRKEGTLFTTTKSHKSRIVAAAPSVLSALMLQKQKQAEMQLKAGPLWSNPGGLVFTNETGGPMSQRNVQSRFKTLTKAAGLEGVRFHDTRHTFAVNSLRAGDDPKSVQGNLGHATAAFTLDRYGHVTERMRQDSAARMEGFIKDVLNL